jgi:RNA polymerase sigma-70 factor (ECF subfamily)
MRDTMQEISDLELITRVRAGDAEGYRLLVERYQSLIYSIAYRMVRDRSEAEDLAQDVFLKAYQMLDSFREEASFKTWICRIATNRCIDWRRKHASRAQLTAEVEEAGRLSDDKETPEQVYLRRERLKQVRDVIEQMPDKYRTILLMHHFQGMSYKDIAEREQISPRTVETRLYRAKQMLRNAMEEEGGAVDGSSPTSDDLEVSGGRTRRN